MNRFTLPAIIFISLFVILPPQSADAQSCGDSDGDNAAGINPTFSSLNIEGEGTCIGDGGVNFIDECAGGSHTEYYCTGSPGDTGCHAKIGTCTCASATTCATIGTGGIVIFENPLKSDSFQELLDRVLNLMIIFGGSLYVLMIFIAALLYISGGANPQKRVLAKNILIFSTIGFFILILGRVIFFAIKSLIL